MHTFEFILREIVMLGIILKVSISSEHSENEVAGLRTCSDPRESRGFSSCTQCECRHILEHRTMEALLKDGPTRECGRCGVDSDRTSNTGATTRTSTRPPSRLPISLIAYPLLHSTHQPLTPYSSIPLPNSPHSATLTVSPEPPLR